MFQKGSLAFLALASVAWLAAGTGTAHAFAGASCLSTSGDVVHMGADGSDCEANVITAGKAKAKAVGDSQADALADHGASAVSRATGKSHSGAEADTGATANAKGVNDGEADAGAENFSLATSNAKNTATAITSSTGSGVAKASASNFSAAAAGSEARCTAKATATNHGDANAECTTDGGFVNATASGGGFAEGTDTAPPTCDTSGGGKARVRSTGGNCG